MLGAFARKDQAQIRTDLARGIRALPDPRGALAAAGRDVLRR